MCRDGKGLVKTKFDELLKYMNMGDEIFYHMLQKIFYFKYEFYGKKMTAFDIIRVFQNLFPCPASIFKKHMSELHILEYNDMLVKKIFKKAKNLVCNNLKSKIEVSKLNDPEKLLEAFIFMLLSQVMSDCSFIVHVIQFHDRQDMENFKQKEKDYEFKEICGRQIGFKCNLIDTELKRFKKIKYYLKKEEEYMEGVFNKTKE